MMQKATISLVAIAVLLSVTACGRTPKSSPYVPRDGQIHFTLLQTTAVKPLHVQLSTPFTVHGYPGEACLDLDSASASHPYLGTGASLTDASCWLLSRMSSRKRRAFLKDAFTAKGMNLNIVRLNCGSSDYATELYNYDDTPGDVALEHFSIDRDRLYMIPVIREIQSLRKDLFVFSSVWSEPGWMKTSGTLCGGALKDECLPVYARYLAAYAKAYREAGIRIDAMTVHNEPLTDQDGACPASLISEEQERLLAGKYIPEAFDAAGLDTRIWIHDHNYHYWERVDRLLEDAAVKANVSAVAWHPYGRGVPEMMTGIRTKHPGLEMHLTERGPNKVLADEQTTTWWSRVIFGALNGGCSSYSSWNLLLDTDGQPVTGKFPCGGLEELDTATGAIIQSTQALVFRQYCPYVKPGADILELPNPDPDIASIVFRNPDGQMVVVLSCDDLRTRKKFQIKYKDRFLAVALPLGTWSLSTIIIEP